MFGVRREKLAGLRCGVGIIFLALAAFGFVSGGESSVFWAAAQPGPLLARALSGGAPLAVFALCVLAAATFLFGRFFCAVCCPPGVLQDLAVRARGAYRTDIPNLYRLRYIVAVVSLALLSCGWASVFKLVEPFSRFGGIVSAFVGVASVGGFAVFILFAALALRKKRVYCAAICPIGTLLGLCAKYGVWRMRIGDACSGCGLCEWRCPVGCIDSAGRVIDNERCLRCMRCVSACPNGCVSLSRTGGVGEAREMPPDGARRVFLAKGALVLLGAASSVHVLGRPVRALARSGVGAEGLILPPGALDARDFRARCTSCHFCVLRCPSEVIKPSRFGLGPVYLDLSENACLYDCTLCNNVCPSAALKPLPLAEKQWLKIGEAVFDETKCRVITDGEACDLCAAACPKGTIYMNDGPGRHKIPEVGAYHCIGCGVCRSVCPAKPKALTVKGVDRGKFARI